MKIGREGHGYFGRHDVGHSSPLKTGEQRRSDASVSGFRCRLKFPSSVLLPNFGQGTGLAGGLVHNRRKIVAQCCGGDGHCCCIAVVCALSVTSRMRLWANTDNGAVREAEDGSTTGPVLPCSEKRQSTELYSECMDGAQYSVRTSYLREWELVPNLGSLQASAFNILRRHMLRRCADILKEQSLFLCHLVVGR
jgi:hypothetical protein